MFSSSGQSEKSSSVKRKGKSWLGAAGLVVVPSRCISPAMATAARMPAITDPMANTPMRALRPRGVTKAAASPPPAAAERLADPAPTEDAAF